MKDEKKKNIKTIAEEIARLEKLCQSGTNLSENQAKLEQLVCSLSFQEMLAIDEYILEKKLLTK